MIRAIQLIEVQAGWKRTMTCQDLEFKTVVYAAHHGVVGLISTLLSIGNSFSYRLIINQIETQ